LVQYTLVAENGRAWRQAWGLHAGWRFLGVPSNSARMTARRWTARTAGWSRWRGFSRHPGSRYGPGARRA